MLFWICVAGGVLAVVGILAVLREVPAAATGRMDLPGAALLAAALVSLLLPLARPPLGVGRPADHRLLVLAAVLLVGFVLVERRTASPLVDMVTNARPALLLTNVASVCVGFALFASLIGTASYVQAPAASGYGFGSSVLASGLCLLPSGVAMILLSPVSAKLSSASDPRSPSRWALRSSRSASWAASCSRARSPRSSSSPRWPGPAPVSPTPRCPAWCCGRRRRSELAAANGLNTLARSVGSSLASAVGGTLLAASTITLGTAVLPSLTAYRVLFAVCAGAALLGAVIALLIPQVRSAEPSPVTT